MAESCSQSLERIEETVLQPMDQWVQRQEERCQNEPCIWWMLCLNKLVCTIITLVEKVVVWVTTVVVRWTYRTVCTIVSLAIGILALLIGRTDILLQALSDLWSLIKDAFYSAVGLIIYVALRIVDVVQTLLGIQSAKRKLTKEELEVLRPIFRKSINLNAIEIVDGNAGLLGISGRPFTMGYTIYLPNYSLKTLVHECVHTWQYQWSGYRYIGSSVFNQLDQKFFSPGYNPYEWKSHIDAGETWYTLRSVEAQAKFIDDVWSEGVFKGIAPDGSQDINTDGAFFIENPKEGSNLFVMYANNYTEQANDAWRIIRTG